MAPNDQKTEVVPVLAAAYVASEIVLPLVFAIVLKLLLQPALPVLERANTRGAASDPCVIRSDRRLGYGHFRTGPYLGSQASGGHYSA